MANVRWKDKTSVGTLAAGDRMPVTDVSDTDTDKYTTPAQIATYVNSAASIYTPEMYSAVGDGSTNDATALQSMFTAAAAAAAGGANVIIELSKVYAVESVVTFSGWTPGNVTLRARDGGGLKATGSADFNCLTIGSGGLTGTSENITTNAVLGATSIVVNNGGSFSTGQYVVITNAAGSSSAPSDSSAMLNRIKGISSNTLTLERALTFAINTANTATCATATIANSGLTIDGLTLDGSSATGNNSGLQVQCCIDPVIRNVKTVGFRSAGQTYTLVDRGIFEDLSDDGSCSAIANAAVAFDRVSGADIHAIRSRNSGSFGVAIDYLADCSVRGVDVANATGRALKTAGSCGNALHALRVTGCASTGISITAASRNNTGSNWVALGCASQGIWFNGSGNTGNMVTGVMAAGNVGADIATSTSGGINDAGTIIIGYNDAAVVTLNSPSTRAISTDRLGAHSNIDTRTNNISVGASFPALTSGNFSVAIGSGALVAMTSGLNNFGLGFAAANKVTTGSRTVAVGVNAANAVTTADGVTAVGGNALYQATGAGSVGIGDNAGFGLTSGSDVICIGRNAGYSTQTNANCVIIGATAEASSNSVANEITLGNSSITALRCYASLTVVSDARDKSDIEPLPLGLAFLNSLRPVRWTWAMRDGGKVGVPDAGFVAQELQQASREHGVEWLGLVYDSNPEKLEVQPGKLLPVLVKAVQELSAEVQDLKAKLQ